MTVLEVSRDLVTGHYDMHMRLTEIEALDLARRIIAAAEPPREPPAPPAEGESDVKA